MARKPLSPEAQAAKVAKMKATKAAKKSAALAMLGLDQHDRAPIKKSRKKRVLTEEQKAAATERLAKARAAKGPSQNKFIDESVRNLPDEDTFSYKNVRQWQAEAKAKIASMRGMNKSKDAKERLAYAEVESYITNLGGYLRNGIYSDYRYGPNGSSKVKWITQTNGMAYYADGTPKRTVGVWYSDIADTWTQEMENND